MKFRATRVSAQEPCQGAPLVLQALVGFLNGNAFGACKAVELDGLSAT
jgi:hypothetical protein